MTNTLFVGIDVSKQNNTIRFTDSVGNTLALLQATNDLPGAEFILQKFEQILSEYECTNITIGMESTSVYADHLALFFRENEFLINWNLKVYILNPKRIKNFKASYSDMPKTDNIDSLVIADFLRNHRLPKEVYLDEKYLALRNLTRARFQASQNLSREKTRFLDTLFHKFSALDSSGVFSDTFGATSLAVISEFFSTDEINEMPFEDLTSFLRDKGKNKFADPKKVAAELQAAARRSYRIPKTFNQSLNELIAVRSIGIYAIEKQIKDLDKAITKYMQAFPDILTSIPGIGPVYSAGLLAEICDVKRFDSQASLAKYAGLAWNKHESGPFVGSQTPMIASGNKYLKYYLLEAANKVRVHDALYKRYYASKLKEVPKHQHKRALALTARKLVRLIYSLLSKNQLYIPPSE